MRHRSLRLRLLVAAALSLTMALVVAGFGLVLLFERHVERRIDEELDNDLRQLAGAIGFDSVGDLALTQRPADPRFGQPLSGLYWQITDETTGQDLRSRSLWDSSLNLPTDTSDLTAVHRHVLPGPAHATLILRERRVAILQSGAQHMLRIAVGIDQADVIRASHDFAGDVAPSLALLGLALLAAAWVQILVGLRPLEAVRRGVEAVHAGLRSRLPTVYPDEVLPLANEINDLLDAQDRAIIRSRSSAADLAHGLRTPLTVLGADARRLRERGLDDVAGEIEALVETMRRHVERAITKARLRPHRGAAASLRALVDRIIGIVGRAPRAADLAWENKVPDDLKVAIDADDLAELLGNLIENATKWAGNRVRVAATALDGVLELTVEDDGPGIPATQRASALRRGVRLAADQAGYGLGLAIVGDIVETYAGSLRLEDSAMGGLRVSVTLPMRERE
ncbi:HAMP domain-containing histidine kinase [Mycobacterium sp. KBS0706]|uniref:sensor histidine kinase n=1 Tax=Mycobacterium sp. KBS0706 TaxID=2578109 RepID=UPI00110F7DA8|nr:HAMP domain-containing sensor histidine kinase [Mycobacterium sp. KBS0706]TSD83404.1 HAMP domain-containing histidine kinase [Mycobacterium sp. KBS0706]